MTKHVVSRIPFRHPRSVVTVDRQATVASAAGLLKHHGIGCLVVADEGGKLIGILSERDVISRVVGGACDPSDVRVGDVMTTAVECISGDFTLGDVSEKMLKSGHQAFPYTDREGNLCGIVTSNDVKDAISDGMDRSTPFSSIKKVCQAEVAYPDEELQAVLDRMIDGSYGHVPVVRRSEPNRLAGIITRKDIMKVFNIRATERKDRWKRK